MKVYIVIHNIPYEFNEIVRVFTIEETAQELCNKLNAKLDLSGYENYSVEEWELEEE